MNRTEKSASFASLACLIESAEREVYASDARVVASGVALKTHWKANLPGVMVVAAGAVILRKILRSSAPAARDPVLRWAMRAAAPLITLYRARAMTAFSALAEAVAAKKVRALVTAPSVDLSRFGGLWYEIARLPTRYEGKGDRDITAHYQVFSDGVRVTNRSQQADGRQRTAVGRARVVDMESNAKLKVSFASSLLDFLPVVWSDLWILDVTDDYNAAIIGTPDRDSLWLLARDPTVSPEALDEFVAKASALGFDTPRLVQTQHTIAAPNQLSAEPIRENSNRFNSVQSSQPPGTSQPLSADADAHPWPRSPGTAAGIAADLPH